MSFEFPIIRKPEAPASGPLARQFAGEIAEKSQAGRELRLLDIFVGLVRLIDRARPAHDGGNAGRLEMPDSVAKDTAIVRLDRVSRSASVSATDPGSAASGGASASISVAIEGPLT